MMYSSAQDVAKRCRVEARARRAHPSAWTPVAYATGESMLCGFCDFEDERDDVKVVLEHMKQEHPEELSGLAKWPDGEFVIIDETMMRGELTVPEEFYRDQQ
jgi:hypothetical protein